MSYFVRMYEPSVDSAMAAINELRAMSPASLEHLEREEEEARVPTLTDKDRTGTSTLTPLLQGISVGR